MPTNIENQGCITPETYEKLYDRGGTTKIAKFILVQLCLLYTKHNI